MSIIQCSSCKSMLPEYSRFCKHCGAVINSPDTDAMRKVPVTRFFKAGNAGGVSAHHIPVSAEQAWGKLDQAERVQDREGERNYTLAPIDPGKENPPGKRQLDPETERLPAAGNFIKPLTRTVTTPQETSPFEEHSPVTLSGQLPAIIPPPLAVPRIGEQAQTRRPGQSASHLPGVRPVSTVSIPSRPVVRPYPVQPKKILMQPQRLESAPAVQHSLMPAEQDAAQELVDQLTLENLTGLPLSRQRLQVQPLHPLALMRQEPFSIPVSLRISPLSVAAKRLFLSESIIAILLIIGLVGAFILTFVYISAPQPLLPSKPVLVLIGSTLPGSVVTLHGSNFLAGSNVKFSIDTTPLVRTNVFPNALASYTMHSSDALSANIQTQKSVSSLNDEIVVKSDGTFDKTFAIPLTWEPGSSHSVQAYVQNRQTALSVRLDFVVQQPGNLPTSTSEPTAVKSKPSAPPAPTASPFSTVQPSSTVGSVPAPIPAPTVTPTIAACISVTPKQLSFKNVAGQGNAGGQTVTLANCGDAGNWSSSVSTSDGGNWLSIDTSNGNLNGGSSQRLSIITHGTNLGAGTYTGQVTFTSGSTAVNVNVSLTVTPQPACIQTSTPSLALTGVAGLSDPASQVITLTSCGGGGNWSAVTSTVDGNSWLNVSSAHGTLGNGESKNITVKASNLAANLDAGTYTGYITFTSGTSSALVKVTLTVTASQACVQPDSQALTFTTSSASQIVTLTNCGGAGTWSAAVLTTSGGNWLTVAPTSNALDTGSTAPLTITALPASVCGTYTGQVTITMTTSTNSTSVVVNVTLNQTC